MSISGCFNLSCVTNGSYEVVQLFEVHTAVWLVGCDVSKDCGAFIFRVRLQLQRRISEDTSVHKIFCSSFQHVPNLEDSKHKASLRLWHLVIAGIAWPRQLRAVLWPWRSGFGPESVHKGFVVDKGAVGQISSTSVFPRQYHSTIAPHSFFLCYRRRMALATYSIAILLKMRGVRLTADCCIGWCVVAWGQHDGAVSVLAWRDCGNWQGLELLVVVVVLWVVMSLDPVGGYHGYHSYWGVCWLHLVLYYFLCRKGRMLQEWTVWWLTDWVTDWLTDWLIDWLTDLLTDWPIDWLTDLLIDWLIGWLTDWLTDRLTDGPIDWLMDRLTDWLTDWLTNGPIDWLTDWLADWLIDWLTDRPTDWLSDWLIDWPIDWLTDWLIDWLNDWLIILMHVRCGFQELPSRLTCMWHPNVQ